MIQCIIRGKNSKAYHTHSNNYGQITVFIFRDKGCWSPRSFNLSEYKTVEDFLKSEYSAKILEDMHY